MHRQNVREVKARAMGTTVHAVIVCDPAATADVGDVLSRTALFELNGLEQRWSRFEPSSEISRLNRRPDRFHLVSSDTALLIERSVQAWRLTGGIFDPTVLPNVAAVGYDCRFEDMQRETARCVVAAPPPGCAAIEVDRLAEDEALVRLGADVGFDPGGLGKGLAADLIAGRLLSEGAAGAMVNVGGDLVCAGMPPTESGWLVDVNEPQAASWSLGTLALSSGAVATSTTRKRSWRTSAGRRHHVIDPRTGDSSVSQYVLAAVVADAGWRAEALATQLLVSGDPASIDPTTAGAAVVDVEGRVARLGCFERMMR